MADSSPPPRTRHKASGTTDLRLVAAIEAGKGLLVLATAFAIFDHIHADVQLAAEQLIRHFHLNPAQHYPRIFLELADHLDDRKLLALGLGASVYAALRLVEALGLWCGKRWAWLLGMASAGIYVPAEIFELFAHTNWAGTALLLTNLLILLVLWRGRQAAHAP